MQDGIIYVCHSINNKNVREGELEILRKFEDKLYFEFGENEMNVKKRFYNDLEILNKDFNALLKLKERPEQKSKEVKQELEQEEIKEVVVDKLESTEKENIKILENESEKHKKNEKEVKKTYKKLGKNFLV